MANFEQTLLERQIALFAGTDTYLKSKHTNQSQS